jgi:Na+/citrate or Na+/malate symporter
MTMIPYAQVARRTGGAITVTLAWSLFAKFGV